MKEEDILAGIAFAVLVFLAGAWFYQDFIKASWYWMDIKMLSLLQYLPFLGDYYGQMLRDYRSIESGWASYWQYLVVGQAVCRPAMVALFFPMCVYWALQARKARNAQGFDTINKAYIDKHYRTLEPAPQTRQQWTVRHWFHHFGLHKLVWGSEEWEFTIHNAMSLQLGPPSTDPESQALLKEFATIVRKELDDSFSKDKKIVFEVDEVVRIASEKHFYLTPAMVRILGAARDDYGVVSPNPMRNRLFEKAEWIPIWFSLNGLGRQTTHIESLGALSHFYVEVAYDEPLEEPQFRNALKGLDQYREHLLDQLRLDDLDESEKYKETVDSSTEEPHYDYSLTSGELDGALGISR